jgi:hypothetical protein
MSIRFSLLVLVACLCATASAQAVKQPLGPEIPISTPPQSRAAAADIAADPATNRYFAVYAKGLVSNPEFQLWGRLLDHNGKPLGGELLISDEPEFVLFSNPVVTYNAALGEYLVVWEWQGKSQAPEVRAQRVSAAGEKIGDRITVWSGQAAMPSVACSSRSGACLVSWWWSDVHARLIAPGGALPAQDFVVSTHGNGAQVGYSLEGDRFLVAWEEVGGVIGQTVDGDGVQRSPRFPIAGAGYGRPRVAYNSSSGEFAVVFASVRLEGASLGSLAAARVRPPDTVLPPVVLSHQSTSYDPRIAFDSVERSYLVMWREYTAGGGRFLGSDLSSGQVAANFAGAYENAAYNSAADEYLLIRPHCNQPGDESAVCVLRVGAGGTGAAADRRSPALRLTLRRVQRIVRQRGLVIRASCDEQCRVRASGSVSMPGRRRAVRLRIAKRTLAPNATTKLRIRPSRATLRKLRRAFRARTRLAVRITVTATDAAGNRSGAKRKIRARR